MSVRQLLFYVNTPYKARGEKRTRTTRKDKREKEERTRKKEKRKRPNGSNAGQVDDNKRRADKQGTTQRKPGGRKGKT